MIKIDKSKFRYFIIAILAAGIFLLLFYISVQNSSDHFNIKTLEKTLPMEENIIDYVQDKTIVYSILSRSAGSDYGDLFAVFEMEKDGSWKRVYENDFQGLKPWKIELADLDGDGEKEILTAVRKATRFDQNEKNRLFVFNYKKGKLVKKWTGSDIAGTWEDFISGNLLSIPGEELIFVEKAENQEEKISIYYWFDFGFLRLAESKSYEDIQKLSILKENRIQISYKGEKKEKAELTVKEGEIVEIIN